VEAEPAAQFSGKEGAREAAPGFGDYLARLLLTNESGCNRIGLARLIQPESFDVRVRRDALCLGCRLDLLDLHGSWLSVSAPPTRRRLAGALAQGGKGGERIRIQGNARAAAPHLH
jgi:hypothetical protein